MKNIFLMGTICLVAFGAFADSKTEILMDKVERMEAELALLQRKLYQGSEVPSSSQTASVPSNIDDFYSRMDAQNQVIQDLTQKVEQLQFELNTLGER